MLTFLARSFRSGHAGRSLLAAALVVTGACTTETGKAGSNDQSADVGGTIIMTVPDQPESLFPPAIDATQTDQIASTIFDRLAEIGPAYNTVGDAGFQPRLATGWKWADDSLSIAFSLNARARWHDGAPLLAKDVQFTFRAYADTASGSVKTSQVSNIDSVSTPDSLTAVFWFKRRMPQQFLDATYHMYIMPSHILGAVPMRELRSQPFGRAPVGTGRFRFMRWIPNERLEIIADTANARGRAKLDRVIWVFTSDPAPATVQLFSGEADFFERLSLDNLALLPKKPQLRAQLYPSLSYSYLGFHLRSRTDSAQPHPIFGDVRVRRALTMAIDRERIMRSVFDTLARLSIGPSPRALFPYDSALRPLPYDLAKARALLDSAGWTLVPGNPVRTQNGKPLEFEVLVSTSSPSKILFATILQAQLKAIGVSVQVQSLEAPPFRERMGKHDFDAILSGWQVDPGLQGLRQRYASTGASNVNDYRSPAFDARLDSALASSNPRKAEALWVRTFQQILDEAPSVFLYEENIIAAMQKRIRPTSLPAANPYADLADWTIDPAQRIDRDKMGLGGGR